MLSHQQIGTWADERTLWTHARAVVPRNYKAMLMLGVVEDEAGHPREARNLLYEAYHTAPNAGVVRFKLGGWHLRRNEFAQARPHLAAAAQAFPHEPGVHASLGLAALRSGDREQARAHIERALELAPDDF